MQHPPEMPYHYLQMSSVEDKIASKNPVRFIDAFVEHIAHESVGFAVQKLKSDGRPSFINKVFQ